MNTLDYFIKRSLLIIPTFIGITFVCFALCLFLPGGPVEQKVWRSQEAGEGGGGQGQNNQVSQEQIEALKKAYGFDKPLPVQYWTWLWEKRMGLAFNSHKWPEEKVGSLIYSRFKVSLIFGITGILLSYLICIPLGIIKALKDGKAFDTMSSIIIIVGYAIPGFAFGLLLKVAFCGTIEGWYDIFPHAGFESQNFANLSFFEKVKDRFMHMFLPIICYMAGSFATLTLLMKNSIIEQISQDYVRTIVAMGGSFRWAVWGHAFRNALIPIVTGFGEVFLIMFAGSILIERVFEIPGMGMLSFEAIVSRDYFVFMGILAVSSLLALLANIFRDFCYIIVDPRINFDQR